MSTHIYLRGGTAAAWVSSNPALGAREMGIETDTGKIKVGDGTTLWTSLEYMKAGWGDIIGNIGDQSDLQSALNAKEDNLGFTPENIANKGSASGYCELDAGGLVPNVRIPDLDGGTP